MSSPGGAAGRSPSGDEGSVQPVAVVLAAADLSQPTTGLWLLAGSGLLPTEVKERPCTS